MNPRLINIVSRFLKESNFEIDGFKYEFYLVDYLNDNLRLGVNVITPKKNQSFVQEVFINDIDKILNNLAKYIGMDLILIVSTEILINGEHRDERVFLSEQKENEIIDQLNNQMDHIFDYVRKNLLSFDVFYRKSKDFYYFDYYSVLNFYFDLSVSNIKIDDVQINPDIEDVDSWTAELEMFLIHSDDYRSSIEDIIHEVTESELRLTTSDNIYYQVHIHINDIDGMEPLKKLSGYTLTGLVNKYRPK